jgi:hypothetical protein
MNSNRLVRKYTICLAGLGALLYWATDSTAEQPELLSIVRAGHRSARESIRTYSATVTVEVTFSKQPTMVLTGRYWRSLDLVRVLEKEGKGTDDYLVKDSEIHQVGQGADPKSGRVHYAATRRSATQILCVLDVWNRMMIDFIGPNNGGRYDFDRFLEFAKEAPKAVREKSGGHNCIRVDLSYMAGSEQKATLWFDMDHNYLIRKKTVGPKGSSSSYESEIIEFAEPEPGVFIPIKCRGRGFNDGAPTSIEETTLTDVKVNKPIPNTVFQLPAIPSGTILDDRIERKRYPIDSNWHPIGPATQLAEVIENSKSERQASDYHAQSTSEPVPFSRWLIITSLFVLVIASSFLVYRRLRLRGGLQRPN